MADLPRQSYIVTFVIRTYGYYEANFSSQSFDFFKIKLDGWVVGGIIFEVPKQWT